ncbi:tRNA (adenosine(37)-N6)-threonylcarbamoyltransferase complex dimerization subunit type 1 TsaB [Mucilaginibacter phyllosphaerae]|uniref:tRNA (Adenosine(37)-N6)-threonylcarbamoyltransferase complex dimerization subunit type 1 TsaB n=1 Tax=Mucilaginibacter phyllosphaerae TaxID=1812349 RepID=A0A4Y8A880_9SPHI|nr:tRNA (adenosine(37)-N6)-threonylcarbamoyltransferase complex dimerization subunit type 1 TsaB [Mucilaginibacter phyllosphaerae]MBB3970995.1 tRNA threonylcarbamoyladenosine biosynthesis protein TsaB [Mucilaginibacter phyllosphaerae]TEW64074.1 tRNA (adenosine(37)-N6)-threonylcarbamoyltransferase complex dimerization subunit type 1 TsaB [Mucilaginibacter phyllosphaerae]GGH05933.1 tRNA (adenosine(37)-N6)-threonylcarbamoyltransferase complex dimerization subunit type 1 TsaB [Mucilaginibacter phyll
MILQIETATTSCSVALTKDGQVLAFKEIDQRNIHAEVITVYIDEILASRQVKYADLDAIAVSCGPGSYTGLRIGVSTAKGICFALDKPLIAVETLAAMAKGVVNDHPVDADTLLCPMIDARRMEVYTAIFNQAGKIIKPTAAEIIDADSFGEILSKSKVLFFGDGAGKCKNILGHNSNALFLPDFVNSAKYLTAIAADKYHRREFVDVAYFEPYYLKDFIAGKKAGD